MLFRLYRRIAATLIIRVRKLFSVCRRVQAALGNDLFEYKKTRRCDGDIGINDEGFFSSTRASISKGKQNNSIGHSLVCDCCKHIFTDRVFRINNEILFDARRKSGEKKIAGIFYY